MKKIILILTLILMLASCSATTEEINSTKNNEGKTIEFKVSDKAIKRYDNQDKYLIYTNKGTYEITDSILNMQFNSSDIYGYLEKDKCYNAGIDAFSFRISLISSYENIVSATEIPCKN